MLKKLYIKNTLSPIQTLVFRILTVIGLLLSVVFVLWIGKEGLHDTLDNEVTFSDLLYFAMVTVTTVGYGDIVPVTPNARLIDALFITPVRVFIWLIFVGTAYQFVIQKVLEGIRMKKLQSNLSDHIVICGYGETGRVAALELSKKGTDKKNIVIVDLAESCVQSAASSGYIALLGDPTHKNILIDAGIKKASNVIICLGSDESNALSILNTRNLNGNAKIIACVNNSENFKLMRQAGANVTVQPSQAGGYLLADAVFSSYINDYVLDLLNNEGLISFAERYANGDDAGQDMRNFKNGIVLRIYRNGEPVGFWEDSKSIIQEGDLLLYVEPNEKN